MKQKGGNMVLGVDIGYGYTKCFFGRNNSEIGSHIFRTAVSRFIPRATFAESIPSYNVNGEEFIVGDDAIREGKLLNTRRKEFVGSNAYYAILSHAMHVTVNAPLNVLVLGLPPGQYTKEYVEELTESMRKVKAFDPDGNLLNIPPIVKFIPQGAGIFFSHVINENPSDYSRKVVVLDIGYYTVDMLFFDKGKYVEGVARSFPFGVFEIYESIKKAFTQEHKIYLKNDESVDTLIKTGFVDVAGVQYKFDCSKAYEFYSAQINSALEEYVEGLPSEVDVILAGGGGVRFLNNICRYKITSVVNPQIANAVGYFEYGKHYSK